MTSAGLRADPLSALVGMEQVGERAARNSLPAGGWFQVRAWFLAFNIHPIRLEGNFSDFLIP